MLGLVSGVGEGVEIGSCRGTLTGLEEGVIGA